jgi:hypothetical protein
MALIAPFPRMTRSTNRSTTAAPDPPIQLLYVISPAAPGLHPRERGLVRQEVQPNAMPNITNRGVSARPRRPDGRLAAGQASIVA